MTSPCCSISSASRPIEAQARGECYVRPNVEDVVFGYLKFPSGIVAHLHLSWLDPHKTRQLTVVGSQKMVVFDDMETDRKVTVYDKSVSLPQSTDSYGEYVSVRFGDISIPRIPNDEPLRLECQEFVDAIEGARDAALQRPGGPRRRRGARGDADLARRGRPRRQARRMSLRPDPRGPNLHVGDDVTIGEGVEFGANVVVHDGCSIGAGTRRRRQRRARQAAGARRPVDGAARAAARPHDRRAAARSRRARSSSPARRSPTA